MLASGFAAVAAVAAPWSDLWAPGLLLFFAALGLLGCLSHGAHLVDVWAVMFEIN